MVHLLLSLLGYDNPFCGSQFSLIQPLIRAGRARAGVAPDVLLPLSQLNEKAQNSQSVKELLTSVHKYYFIYIPKYQ